MSQPEKGLSTLRTAHEQLTTQITRFALLRLFILVILVFTFFNAFTQLKTGRISQIERTLRERDHEVYFSESLRVNPFANETTGENATVSFERPLLAASPGSPTLKPSPSVTPIPNTTPSPPSASGIEGKKLAPAGNASSVMAESKTADVNVDVSSSNDLVLDSKRLAEEARRLLANAFLISFSVLGSRVEFDLRLWIYFLPYFFLVSEIHLQILRKKRKLLTVVGAKHIQDQGAGDVYDQLLFSSKPNKLKPFARHPSEFEEGAYYFCIMLLVVSLAVIGNSFWQLWPFSARFLYLQLLGTFVFWGAAYYRYVATNLDEQVTEQTSLSPAVGMSGKIWRWIYRKVIDFLSLIKRHTSKSLFTGSVLVLSSLYLLTADSCRGRTYPGIALVKKTDESIIKDYRPTWYTAVRLDTEEYRDILDGIGKRIYILCLSIAVLTILYLIIFRLRKTQFVQRALNLVVYRLCVVVSLFLVTDATFFVTTYSPLLFFIKLVWWFITVLIIARYWIGEQTDGSNWPRIRSTLIVIYAPLFVNALASIMYIIWRKDLYGVLTLFFGFHLLTLSYLQLNDNKTLPKQGNLLRRS